MVVIVSTIGYSVDDSIPFIEFFRDPKSQKPQELRSGD
jgi:hypothetical protein